MKKLVKVHMLPTKNEGVIISDVGPYNSDMVSVLSLPEYLRGHERPHNHLYFTSEEEPKQGDWFISGNDGELKQYNNGSIFSEGRKVIATTDKKVKNQMLLDGFDRIYPNISQQFIEEYCKTGDIDEVLLEYEAFCRRGHPFNYCPDCKGFKSETCEYGKNLLLDSNNCAVIHSIKESWNREEVNVLMEKAYVKGYSDKNNDKDHKNEKLSDWIKENLN